MDVDLKTDLPQRSASAAVDIDLSDPSAAGGYGVVPGLVWAFRIHEDGTADALAVDKPIENRHDGWLWLHLNLADMRARQWLRTIELPAAAVALLTSHDNHQQLHAADASIYGVFCDLTRNLGETGNEFAHLHFVMTERVLVSGRYRALAAVAPIAAVGARAKAKVTEEVTAFAAIFNGNAAGPGNGEPQLRDNHGLAFRITDAPWLIGQVQFDFTLDLGRGKLPGNFTPGGWYHTGQFDDQRFTASGVSLADPLGSGVPGKLRGNYGIFGVLEQTLYRPAGAGESRETTATEPGVTAFARAAYSPPDRNLIDLYADASIGFNGMIPGRPLDRFGAAIAYMHISSGAQLLDRDTRLFTGALSPIRSNETLVEVIYEAHIKPGWLVAPYFQYVFRPSGGVPNPNDPTGISRIGDAAVFGLTTTFKY